VPSLPAQADATQPRTEEREKHVTDGVWGSAPRHTTTALLLARTEKDPDSEYLDIGGTAFTAAQVAAKAAALGAALVELGVKPGDRVASLLENSPEALLIWWATQWAGAVGVPINTAYKGEYLSHQLRDSGATVLVVAGDLADRAVAVTGGLPELRQVVVTGPDIPEFPSATAHRWDDLLTTAPLAAPVDRRPSELATFIYTGGTTGPSKGCMLSHNYHEALATQIGTTWGRTPDDVLWTPLPLFHFNALTTAVIGALVFGGRSAIYRRFSVSNFWPEMNRTKATLTSTLGTMAYLLAHDVDRPEMPRSGAPEANTSLRMMGAAPLPPEVDDILRTRFGIETFSGAYGVTEASLISTLPPGRRNKPRAAGMINTRYFDVRIFDDDDNELPRGTDGEIVIRPKLAHVMFEGYWGRPEATVETSRNWWYHTGDIGRIDEEDFLFFVDRKADYLRRRGENISSFEVERILMGHGELADVAVHAVFSKLTEDDVKVTATRVAGSALTEEALFRWCVEQLPYFTIPRYIEFRDELPRSPVGRVLKRDLRDEGVTPTTWDSEQSGITYEKR
jgi:crotonobetaine/carnitine-CoA ligase